MGAVLTITPNPKGMAVMDKGTQQTLETGILTS